MQPSNTNHWTAGPGYINLLNYIIEKAENAELPMNIQSLVREYKEKSGAAETVNCLNHRIRFVRTRIQSFEHMDTKSKVRMMFALSASVSTDFLEELKKNALVEVDDEKRITHYKSNDGSLELKGDHSRSARNKITQFEMKQSSRSWIIDYFENKNDSNAVPKNKGEKKMWNLIAFITEKCENINSPLNITRLATDFKKYIGISKQKDSIERRIRSYRREIQKTELLDTQTSVKQLFGLSATVNSNYLEKLREDALVEVDEENRISYYKANNGDLELRGDHSQSARVKTALLEAKRSHQKLIRAYFENKNNANAVPKNKEEKEMWNLIELITEKCENINSPLSIRQLTKDFNNHFGSSRSFDCIQERTKKYCQEIQKAEFPDTSSEVKQLFGLGAPLDLDCLEKLRKDADVEVDDLNRITKYTANDGGLTLHGDHSRSAKNKSDWIERKKKQNAVENYCNSAGDEDNESDESEEYSSEEFGSEFDSDNDNDHLDETEDFMEKSKETEGFDFKTPVRTRSEVSIGNHFDFDPPTERVHRSEKIEIRETGEEKNDFKNLEDAVIKTRSGRLSKRRLDSNFSYELANSSSSGGLMSSSSSYSKHAKHFHHPTERSHVSKVIEMREDDKRKKKNISPIVPKTEKMRNNGSTGSSSSKQIGSSSNDIRRNELDGYDTNYSIDDQVKLEPFRGSIQEDLNEFKEDEDIQRIPKPLQTLDEHDKIEEESIKIEHEEPAEIKPEKTHNSKIRFFEAMKSLTVSLDTPYLSWIKTKIHQKIQKLEEHDEVILNNEIFLTIELLISRMTNHSVVNLSDDVESVNLSNFLCYLKAAILNSKMIGVEGLVQNISKLIEESQNKRIPMENVTNALRATLDINDF
ncbi:unnamed protein product [Caenorhabditis brenneri]